MRRKISAFMLLLVLVMSVCGIAAASVPDDIRAYAESEGLKRLQTFAAQDPAGTGFADQDQIDNLALGAGFRVHYIDPDKLQAAAAGASIRSILRPADKWQFIVLSDGKPATFVAVGYENGGLTVLSAGGSSVGLGAAYDTLLANGVDKESLTLVSDKGDLLFVALKDDAEVVVPDQSKQAALDGSAMDNTKLYPSERLLSQLSAAQQAPNQDEDGGGREMAAGPAESKPTIPWKTLLLPAGTALLALLAVGRGIRRKAG